MFQFKLINQLITGAVLGLVVAGAASAANWANCGADICTNPNAGNSMVTKHGMADITSAYVHMIYDGITTAVPCQATDPRVGAAKICEYTDNSPTNVGFNTHVKMPVGSGIPTVNTFRCADEGDSGFCDLRWPIFGNSSSASFNWSEPYWVRYGSATQSVTAIASGYFKCTAGYFGVDPHVGQIKTCTVDSPVFQKIPGVFDINAPGTWTDCATEGQTCKIPTNETVVVRYGNVGTKYFIYRILSNVETGGGLSCGHGNDKLIDNGYDPAPGKVKTCSWVRLNVGTANRASISAPTGSWQKIISHGCDTFSCDTSLSYEYGAKASSANQTAKEWGTSLTLSVTGGVDAGTLLGGYTLLATAATSFNYSQSDSFTQSRDTTLGKTITVTCATPPAAIGTIDMYQFVISANEACLAGGGCAGTVKDLKTVCTFGEPDTYKGPRCLPNDFADSIGIACASRNEYRLDVTVAGSGTVKSSAGAPAACDTASVCKIAIVKGKSVTLTATPNPGTVFTSWSGGSCNGLKTTTCTVTNSTANTVAITANFAQPASVTTVNVTGNGSVSSSPTGITNCGLGQTCSQSFTQGSSVTLTAVPNSGATFQKWTGSACNGSTSATCTFTVPTTAVNMTASFGSPVSSLKVTVNGSGAVISSPDGISNCRASSTTGCQANFPQNTSVILATYPDAGKRFLNWTSGPCILDSTRPACQFTIQTQPITATANFGTDTGIQSVDNNGGHDFVISNVKLSTLKPLKGDTFSATVVVKNWGIAARNGGKLRIWQNLSSAPTPQSLGEFKTVDVGIMAPGAMKKIVISNIPAGTTLGAKKLWAFVDANNVITETNENNNVFSIGYRVK